MSSAGVRITPLGGLGEIGKNMTAVESDGRIVVVDTGSTDNTIAVARSGGAAVYARAWTDDFSAARNASIRLATADWILYLDADE